VWTLSGKRLLSQAGAIDITWDTLTPERRTL
jgi:hypothetical protein